MTIFAKVCCEFRDKHGKKILTIHPNETWRQMEAPDAIREDPLFQMLLQDKSLELVNGAEDLKRIEKGADTRASGEARAEKRTKQRSAAPAAEESADREDAEKNQGSNPA